MTSKPRERALKQAPSAQSPMNWRPPTVEDLIGQAKRVAMAQATKAKRLSRDPSATMKLLLYGPPGVGKTSVVELWRFNWPAVHSPSRTTMGAR